MLIATDFYRYYQCPHWPYWERFGNQEDRRPLTQAEEDRLADGLEHERNIVKRQFGATKEVRISSPKEGFARTLEHMRNGAFVIYQGWLMDKDWIGRPDILERHDGKSAFGDWYYVPVDIKRSHELKKEHMAQLTFYAILLERIQGRFPAEPAIVNADGERLVFPASDFMKEFQSVLQTLECINDGEMPEPVYRKACMDTSPWGKACFRLAFERNDIALLFNVDVRKLHALRTCGIATVDQAAKIDVPSFIGCAPGLTERALEAIKRQARSLRNQSVIIRRAFQHVTHGTEIHFDIESHPPTDTDYLYGFWIMNANGGSGRSFISETPKDEKKMWKEFLAWLPTLPDEYTVYHYASYESSRLTVLSKRYCDADNIWLVKFRSRLVDLKEKTREHIVFPLYFYSLKKICQFLGFAWKGDVQTGGASIVAYDEWLKTRNRSILNSIIQYNEEDVCATAFLLNWLQLYAQKEGKEYREPYPWKKK